MPIGPHVVNPEAVAVLINNFKQLAPDVNQLGRRDLALKHGILYSLPDVFTSTGNPPQAALAGLVFRNNIVGDENIHGEKAFICQ